MVADHLLPVETPSVGWAARTTRSKEPTLGKALLHLASAASHGLAPTPMRLHHHVASSCQKGPSEAEVGAAVQQRQLLVVQEQPLEPACS